MATQMPQSPNHLHHLHHNSRRAVDLRIPAIEKYAYCLCLHVKPTTIFIAVFKLIRALLFASIILNTEFAVNEQGQELNLSSLDERHKSTAAAMTILTRIIMASVSAVGIYAVVSGRAALLMPLYAMLLVDFFFSLPAFYSRDLDSASFEDAISYQHRNGAGHPATHPQYTRYSIILFSTVAMIMKIYFLCVVWKCYRYLRLIELVTPIRLSEIYPHLPPTGSQYPIVRVLGSIDSTDLSSGHNVTPPPYESVASSMKPPNYEEAIKSSGTVFTVPNSPVNTGNNTDTTTTTQPQMPRHQQPQQTVVFTIPSPGQNQNVSTQIVGTNSNSLEDVTDARAPTCGAITTTTDTNATESSTTSINMNGINTSQNSSSTTTTNAPLTNAVTRDNTNPSNTTSMS